MHASDAWRDDARSNGPVVLIIDTLPLRSLSLISILNRVDRLAVPSEAPVASHTPDVAEQRIEACSNYKMLIYNTGGASMADRDDLEQIKALRALAPDVPLMIFCDNKSREEIISALNVDEQGFLYVGTNAELALRAFSCIVNGGSYLPSRMGPKRTYSAQRHLAIDCSRTPPSVTGGDNGAAEDSKDEGQRNRNLTARQMAVLELVRRGESNKVIARRLGMREGTVKVHVRQIMRKFGVTNRTQVAVVCMHGDSQKLATSTEA
jgi:DNA-binding NarL/FixJ family response regulator